MALEPTLPSLYELYTSGGITNGLSVNNPFFTLNDRNITIYSGAMHYFRVPKPYWRDRLRKIKAAGLNTVETYIPWNLHEPQVDHYDFGDGTSDMSDFLNITEFFKIVQEEDLFAIVRPGPYICAEWEFGGLPSWLLREDLRVRTSDEKFIGHVTRFFNVLLKMLAILQFTRGGPIIAFQLENEYGSTEWKKFKPEKKYLEKLKELMKVNGVKELLFTSDSPSYHGDAGSLPGIFQAANFADNPEKEFDRLKTLQKNKPAMAMEFWTGWFDHWSENHHTVNNSKFEDVLTRILQYPASVNLYMFHGGTNWGFYNGANVHNKLIHQPDTASYDYDAPLTESGDYTEKYFTVKRLVERFNSVKTRLPQLPRLAQKIAYGKIKIQQQLDYNKIVDNLPQRFTSIKPISMELLEVNNNSGQSYGYTIYRKQIDIPLNSNLTIKGYVHDGVMVLIDGKLVSPILKTSSDLDKFGYWRLKDSGLVITGDKNSTLDLLITNWGRNNFGRLEQFRQFKGLQDDVYLNEDKLINWEIIPMEFKKSWIQSLDDWGGFEQSKQVSLCKSQLVVDELSDTFIDMRGWNTGVVFVNGFNLGRYVHLGPQQTLYLPAPLLKKGSNEIVIFEHFEPASHVSFSEKPIFLTKM